MGSKSVLLIIVIIVVTIAVPVIREFIHSYKHAGKRHRCPYCGTIKW